MAFPLAQEMKDKLVAEKINQIIQEDILNFKNWLHAELEEYLKSARSEGWKLRKYIVTPYYIVNYQKDDLLSLSIFYYFYPLGHTDKPCSVVTILIR